MKTTRVGVGWEGGGVDGKFRQNKKRAKQREEPYSLLGMSLCLLSPYKFPNKSEREFADSLSVLAFSIYINIYSKTQFTATR